MEVTLTHTDNIYYYNNVRYTGKVIDYYENGQNKYEETFKDGKKNGKEIWWYKNGQKWYESTFKDGKLIGVVSRWHKNGQKATESTFKDGKLIGVVSRWHKNGQKATETTYKIGKLIGKVIDWYEDGQKATETTYKDGKKNGKVIDWYEDGKIRSEATYKDGKLINEKEKETMKYKLIAEITGKKLIQYTKIPIDDYEVNKFIKKFGYIDVLEWDAENEKWIEDNIVGGIEFLLEYGFIEEEDKIVFDENKLYFAKDYWGDVVRLNFGLYSSSSFQWSCVNKNLSYRPHKSFEEANKVFTRTQKDCGHDFEIKTFDTLQEAMKFYYPEEEKELTILEKFEIIKTLFEDDGYDDICNVFQKNNICFGLACNECPFN